MKYNVEAVRTYYSVLEFQVEADSREEAEEKARRMIDSCEVEFDDIEASDDDDTIDIYPES